MESACLEQAPPVSHKHNAFEIEMKPFLKWQSDLFADYTLIRASRFMLWTKENNL